MNHHFIQYLIVILVLLAGLVLKAGYETVGVLLLVWGGMSLLIAIPFYFESQKNKLPPTNFERRLACLWIITRRIFCFGFAVAILVFIPLAKHVPTAFKVGILLAIPCLVWVGIVGRKGECSIPKDDLDEYFQKKERYASKKSRYQPIENRIEPKNKKS